MSEEEIKELLKTVKTKDSFAEAIFKLYQNKLVEIYLGDEYEEITTDQIKISYPSVICGILLGASGRCLIINTAYVDRNSKIPKLGNILCLNDYHIKMITELNNYGNLQDSFIKSKDNNIIKQLTSK